MSDPVKIVASPLDDVYEKFKHLDGCLSDPEWCTSGEGAAIYAIAGELWRAVKGARENPCDEICQHSRIYSPVQMQQAIARATEAENKQVIEILDKFYDRIKVAHRHDTSSYSEGMLDGIDLSITEIKNESLRLAQPERKGSEPE